MILSISSQSDFYSEITTSISISLIELLSFLDKFLAQKDVQKALRNGSPSPRGERRSVFGPFRRGGGVAQAAPLSKLKTWLDSANYRNIMSASSSTVPFPARYRRLASAKIQRGGGGLNGATQLRGNPPIRGFPASAFRASAFPLIGRTNEIRTKNPRFED